MTQEEKDYIRKVVTDTKNQDTDLIILASIICVKFPHLTTQEVDSFMFGVLCGAE